MHVDAREIRALLQKGLPDLLRKLLPRAPFETPYMTPLNPTRDDRRPGSFVIWTHGPAAGGFNEYSPKGPPASGDVIDLIAYLQRQPGNRKFALAWARDHLGLRTLDARALAGLKTQARVHVASVSKAQSDALAEKRKRALALWQKSLPIAGSVAEAYLASRRIPLRLIQNREDDLRFIPALEHWQLAKWEGGQKVQDGPRAPVMIAAVRDIAGELTAVHCTFLRADGSGKLDVGEPKLMRGVVKGGCVRISRGADNLTPEEAASVGALDTVILAEGIENALSVAFALPERRVWAALGFRFFPFAPVDHKCVDQVVIAADNDAGPKAADELDAVQEAFEARGLRVSIMRPPAGVKDFNDVLKGDGA